MYQTFFELRTKPFSNTFKREFLFLNEYHRLLLKSLLDDLERVNVQLVTGEAGSGKSTLVRTFLETLPKQIKQVQIRYTAHDESDFIRFIALELGIRGQSKRDSIINAINQLSHDYLRVVLIVDDADKLGRGPLKLLFDILRSLLQKDSTFNLVLVGLPELKGFIENEGLTEGLKDNYKSYFVSNLYREDVQAYINFRLTVAGATNVELFSNDAIDMIYKKSGGLPRVINMICDTALLNAYLMNTKRVNAEIVMRAINDLRLDEDFRLAVLSNTLSVTESKTEIATVKKTSDEYIEEEITIEELAKDESPETVSTPTDGINRDFPQMATYEGDPHSKALPVRVLVLETSARMRMHYENFFKQKAMECRIFKEFNNLFSYLREKSGLSLDILIADSEYFFIKGGLESPEGMKALGILLREHPYLPIIVTSTLPLSTIRNKLLQKGLAYFVCKPELKDIDLSEVKTRLSGFFRELERFREFIERQFSSFYHQVIEEQRNTKLL